MYFTSLPDHSKPGFDEQAHFNMFKASNVIFNAVSSNSGCDNHVGCLSFKTVLSGEEWYGINHHRIAVRPGQFLMLNDDQWYSSRIDHDKVRVVSIFFKNDFASSVFYDAINDEKPLLDHPFDSSGALEFYQTLYEHGPDVQTRLMEIIKLLEAHPYESGCADECLIGFLSHLIQTHKSELYRTKNVYAIKPGTRTEIYKRLCIAKDILHSYYMENLDLNAISSTACMSVPQLVRQFKNVFHVTPHQYLIQVRLKRAKDLLSLPGNQYTR